MRCVARPPKDVPRSTVDCRRVKIALVTDAWLPQVNGVVRIAVDAPSTACAARPRGRGDRADRFRTMPCPTYPEIRLALALRPQRRAGCWTTSAPTASTSRPRARSAGRRATGACRNGRHFTTAFHTRFPEYVAIRTGIPRGVDLAGDAVASTARADAHLRGDHDAGRELTARGLAHTHHWRRGIDLMQFKPEVRRTRRWPGLPRPILLNVGRVAPEKNIGAFLDLDVARHQGRGRRRSSARPDQAPLIRMCSSLVKQRGRTRVARIGSRPVRFSQPDRHLRAGRYRGARLRLAGRRLPSARAAGHSSGRMAAGSMAARD